MDEHRHAVGRRDPQRTEPERASDTQAPSFPASGNFGRAWIPQGIQAQLRSSIIVVIIIIVIVIIVVIVIVIVV